MNRLVLEENHPSGDEDEEDKKVAHRESRCSAGEFRSKPQIPVPEELT